MRILKFVLLASLSLSLGACKSAEEKAAAYYQSALTLLEAGDSDRAIVELQNVFRNEPLHYDARRALADVLMKSGKVEGAYRQYSILIEQYPDTADVRLLLAQVAIDSGSWKEAKRHGDAAIALLPDDPLAQSIATTLAYHDAIEARDEKGMATAAAEARAALDADFYNDYARRIVIDNLLRGENPTAAMSEITTALTLNSGSYPYNMLRLKLLVQNQDTAAIGQQLRTMVELFPDDTMLSDSLIGWYLSQDDKQGAEAFLRQLAGEDTYPITGHIAVVQFLRVAKGEAAAKVELDRLAAANSGTENGDFYSALSSVILFQDGERDTAVSNLETILKDAEPTEQYLKIRNILAQLLISDDNLLAARAEIEEIITQDASNVAALKVRAGWAIEEGRPEDAIIDLRTALGQEPRDASILTLMAQAHEREGNLALAGERLAQAFDISGSGADQALQYAAFLRRDGRISSAQSVLREARTANPQNVGVLVALADLLLSDSIWVEAQDIAKDLRAIGSTEAMSAATMIQSSLLLGQNKVDESIAFLENEIANGSNDAELRLIQIQIRSGNLDAARTALDGLLDGNPTDPTLRTLSANLFAVAGNLDEAERVFRALIAEYPNSEEPVLRLYNLLIAADRDDDAAALIDTAIASQPNAMSLRWVLATRLENSDNFELAIEVYESMYREDSNQIVIANNLASLLSTHRDDQESLDRAALIAQRLRELDAAPFQDTYGWISYRQGNFEEARGYLEKAATGLPNDPLVHFHLGMTYLSTEQTDLARTSLARAVELGAGRNLPQIEIAKAKLTEIGG